jgi:hypothetical protein
MPKMVLRDVASWHRPYLTAKPSHVGSRCGWATYALHHPTACSHLTRGHTFLSGATSSYRAVVGGRIFSRGRSPRARIFDGVFIVWVHVLPNETWSRAFYQGALILCQSQHGAYACLLG